jgi:endo-1,4-beta-xylanase
MKDVLPGEALSSFQMRGAESHLGTTELIEAVGMPFPRALRVCTQVGATQEWHVQLATDTTTTIEPGDVVLTRFWVRCIESMTGKGVVGFVFQSNQGEHENAIELRLSVGSEWVECFVPFQARQRFAAGEARVCLHVGYDRQTIELADIQVTNFGQSVRYADLPHTKLTYEGRSSTAGWRHAAAERIELYRKGNLLVEVVDTVGEPVTDATVEIALRRHTFGFGTAVSAKRINDPAPNGQVYRRFLSSLFNRATFENDLKWPEVYDGVPSEIDEAVAWLAEQQIEIRGHNLLWPSWRWLPQQLQQYRDDPGELRRRAAEHVTQTVAHFRDRLIQWDVVNEPFSEHDLLDLLGRDVMVEWFRLARQADPQVKLFLNDYGIFGGSHGRNEHADHFYDTLWFLRDAAAPLDGIGIQSHFTADLPSPEAIFETLEHFGKLGLPIESTELTINLEDRQLQADYLRDYMTVMFSHPNVDGITIWGFGARGHWRPHSAFFEEDWSIRPMGQAFIDLVQKQWTTRTSARTNHLGRAQIRGFCGTYDVTVTTNDGRIHQATAQLARGGCHLHVVTSITGKSVATTVAASGRAPQ